ncbi:uncharacterized protein CXQ87_004703 [Candidozyma duobushaemuli]|uniref:Uncharacterized protein n=1 Tax=Candidozyma duobushaemuli TaxID=1231522 RepID=A0A2V1AFA0_9ASCO|nr:uncharacterized protein CXQ87_004703 [[Candida] duobushaemulonis]PVH16412.1 hypothetical protein CXQ87_004703 [[Candida] duobushaemulonis]
MNQLLTNHFPPSKDLKKDSLVGVRCLQIRDDLVPLDVGVTPLRARSSLNTSDRSYAPEAFVDVTVEKSIEVELLAKYKPPKQYELVSPGNLVKSGSFLKDFVQLELKSTNTFFCSCEGDVFIKHITIILEEHFRYQHLESKGCCVSEEVRTVVLKDSSINYSIFHADFENTVNGCSFVPKDLLHDCNLPNIGPSFSSNECTRGYAIRFDIDLECASKKCAQRIFTVMEIAVATEVDSSEPILQVHKKQDVTLVEKFPLNSNLAENAIHNLEVILGQQTVMLNKTCREAVHKEYKLHSRNGKRLSFREVDENGQKSFVFEGLLEGCKIPNVLPSTHSNDLHKGYKLNVSIEAHGVTLGSGGCMERIDCKVSESIEVLMGINECYRLVRKEGHEKTYIK